MIRNPAINLNNSIFFNFLKQLNIMEKLNIDKFKKCEYANVKQVIGGTDMMIHDKPTKTSATDTFKVDGVTYTMTVTCTDGTKECP